MNTKPFLKRSAILVGSLIVLGSIFGNSRSYTYKETAVPTPVKLSPRLRALFEKTKILCFGRYAIEVPQEAQLVWGSTSFPSEIKIISGGINEVKGVVEKRLQPSSALPIQPMLSTAGPVQSMIVGKYDIMRMIYRRNIIFIFSTHMSAKAILHLS
ncbi:hypothetical protein [Massilia putida]|uniref:hypothetical protein n=1 Tax=Massilia putida TaxID=1141883 RepID=UPI0012EB6B6A|nr:hypothetical protein [Massilia putida]